MVYMLESDGIVHAIFLKPDRTKIEEYIQRQRRDEKLVNVYFVNKENSEDGETIGEWTLNHKQWWLTAIRPIT